MRLQIQIHAGQEQVLLPWHYPEQLQAVVYRWIAESSRMMAERLHDEGFVEGARRYKLFVYSFLYGCSARATKAGVLLRAPLRWWISSPLEALMLPLAEGLLKQWQFRVGRVDMEVEEVQVEPTPRFEDQKLFLRTLSPLVVSTAVRPEGEPPGGKLQKQFLSPETAEFSRVVKENLRRKARLLGLPPAEGAVHIEPRGMRSRLFRVHGISVRGWEGKFVLTAPAQLQWVAYEAGIGERNGQGFGMVALDRSASRMKKEGETKFK